MGYKKKWIQSIDMDEGAFSKKAEKAGESTAEYAEKMKDEPGKTGKQARLAKTFAKMRKKKKGK